MTGTISHVQETEMKPVGTVRVWNHPSDFKAARQLQIYQPGLPACACNPTLKTLFLSKSAKKLRMLECFREAPFFLLEPKFDCTNCLVIFCRQLFFLHGTLNLRVSRRGSGSLLLHKLRWSSHQQAAEQLRCPWARVMCVG